MAETSKIEWTDDTADDLRTRAALAAMTGILAGGNPDNLFNPEKVAPWCVRQADALIAALKEATDGTE